MYIGKSCSECFASRQHYCMACHRKPQINKNYIKVQHVMSPPPFGSSCFFLHPLINTTLLLAFSFVLPIKNLINSNAFFGTSITTTYSINSPLNIRSKYIHSVLLDSLDIEKILAMKKYKRGTQEQNLLPRAPTIVNYAFTTLILMLFVSSPVWVPEILSQLKLVLYDSLPNMISFFTGPKFLFIICNLIIVILVSESKLSRAPSAQDMYEERLRKNLSYRMPHPSVAKTSLGDDEERDRREEVSVGEVEEEGDPVELHKKVEDFIARVKSQRRVEAKIFVCY